MIANKKGRDHVVLTCKGDAAAFGFYVKFVPSTDLEKELGKISKIDTHLDVYVDQKRVKRVKLTLERRPDGILRTKEPLFVRSFGGKVGGKVVVSYEGLWITAKRYLGGATPLRRQQDFKHACAKIVPGVAKLTSLTGTIWQGDVDKMENRINVEFTIQAPQSLRIDKIDLELLQGQKKKMTLTGWKQTKRTPTHIEGTATYSWKADSEQAFPLDLANGINARLLVYCHRGTFYSEVQEVATRTPLNMPTIAIRGHTILLSPKVATPHSAQHAHNRTIAQSPSINPLLDHNGDWWAPASLVRVMFPAEKRDYNLSVTFIDEADEPNKERKRVTPSSSQQDKKWEPRYDVLMMIAFGYKSDWVGAHRFLTGTHQSKPKKMEEMRKKWPDLEGTWKKLPQARKVHVDIETGPRGKQVYALTVRHRTTIEVKPAFAAEVKRVVLEENVERTRANGKSGNYTCDITCEYRSDKGWITKKGSSPMYCNPDPTTEVNEKGERVTVLQVRPGATVTLDVRLQGKDTDGSLVALAENLPVTALVPAPGVTFVKKQERDEIENQAASVTTFTQWDWGNKYRFISLKCEVSDEYGSYPVKLDSEKGGITVAELKMPYATIEHIIGPSMANEQQEGVYFAAQLEEKDKLVKLA